jgi:hypothetical protein
LGSDIAVGNIRDGYGAMVDHVDAEIALPPFGYVVTSTLSHKRKTLAEHQKLCDITGFARYGFNIWTTVWLKLPAVETHEPLPLDYRSKTEVEEHHRK